ncbi:MAG: undecaprenyl/decaprenyl-phosphate alpha-N-acetylglucosaminyl 1-phosphate transferase [Ruminococcaceae bacterium]|nr:undecaprenyl/decaprenyl-phosphate alpha-N-acetylglucosaminyl 1-phosphate transferase [Oscillospiraceae bacterium]
MVFFNDISILEILICFAISFIVSFGATPFVMKLAYKINALDIPDGGRHIHKKTTPLIGGLGIFAGFFISVLVFAKYTDSIIALIGILLGSMMIVGMGIYDDSRDMRARSKLIIQIIAAALVVFCGVTVDYISVPSFIAHGGIFNLNWIKYPITILWIVAVTNAVNLIDGLDGLAAGVSSIATFSLFFISVIQDNVEAAVISAALAGGCLGFLPYNMNPAKIFMGDTGSQFLGFMLAIISVLGLSKGAVIISFLVPFVILGIPLFDTSFAILRRIIQRRPIMEADRGHLHHKLLDRGFSQKQTVAILYVISILLSVIAVLVAQTGTDQILWIGFSVIILIVIGFVLTKVLNKSENNENEDMNDNKKGEDK